MTAMVVRISSTIRLILPIAWGVQSVHLSMRESSYTRCTVVRAGVGPAVVVDRGAELLQGHVAILLVSVSRHSPLGPPEGENPPAAGQGRGGRWGASHSGSFVTV